MKQIVPIGDTINKVSDTSTVIKFQLLKEGVVQDVSNEKVTVTIANQYGYLFELFPTFENSEVTLSFSSEEMQSLEPGTYRLEVNVVKESGLVDVYPSENYVSLTVIKNLKNVSGNLVPSVTFDNILKSVDEKIDKYTKTVAKGEQGEQGAKGEQGEQGVKGEQGEQGGSVFTAWSSSPDGKDDFTTKGRSIPKNILSYPCSLKDFKSHGLSTSPLISQYSVGINQIHITAPKGSGQTVGIFFPLKNYTCFGQQWTFSLDILNTSNPAIISRFWNEGSLETSGNGIVVSESPNWRRITSTGKSNNSLTSSNAIIYFDTTQNDLDVYIKMPKFEDGKNASIFSPSTIETPYYNGNLQFIGFCKSNDGIAPNDPEKYEWHSAPEIFVNANNIEGVFDYVLYQSPSGNIFKETIDDNGNITLTKQ